MPEETPFGIFFRAKSVTLRQNVFKISANLFENVFYIVLKFQLCKFTGTPKGAQDPPYFEYCNLYISGINNAKDVKFCTKHHYVMFYRMHGLLLGYLDGGLN